MFQIKVISGRKFGAAMASALLLLALAGAVPAQSTPPVRTPTETVREFFKALKEKRFREALGISIYKPAIDGLSQKDFDELRPDFEAMALGAERIEITGEQISGDTATVFVKMADDNGEMQTSKVDLMLISGVWTVGEAVNEKAIREAGKDYFFNVRIQTHEEEVKFMMERVIKAQLVYSSQHNNLYADIPALVKAGLLPADIETTASTGYKYRLTLSSDKKTYFAQAEPAQYGRTGRLSFHLDSTGVFSKKDVGGKPLVPEKK
jgi:ketosteroid isomerase-like protein